MPGGDPAAPVDETDDAPAMPAPRTEGTNKVTFGFTPRIFPTPARESKAEEENEWITKNRAHLRKNKALVGRLDALDFGETDPAWLKGKGDEFYRGGDFRSAISAYTSALELDPEMVSCLSNRAACYLRIAELRECVDDCTAALELRRIEDVPAIDVATEVKLLVRRGTALRQQGSFEASLADYRTATTLDANNPALASDVERLTSLAQCDTLKKQADARFGAGNISEAVELYASALTLEPAFVSCISNRAACYFALGDMPSAIRDCTGALDLLSMDVSQSIGHMQKDTVPSGPVPPAGSDTRRQWVLKTSVATRRGARAPQRPRRCHRRLRDRARHRHRERPARCRPGGCSGGWPRAGSNVHGVEMSGSARWPRSLLIFVVVFRCRAPSPTRTPRARPRSLSVPPFAVARHRRLSSRHPPGSRSRGGPGCGFREGIHGTRTRLHGLKKNARTSSFESGSSSEASSSSPKPSAKGKRVSSSSSSSTSPSGCGTVTTGASIVLSTPAALGSR